MKSFLIVGLASSLWWKGGFSLNFLLLGDWGGRGHSPYTSLPQVAMAAGMDKVAGEINAEFVLSLGDNFYDDGVANDTDPRFFITYENVYTQQSLQVDWHVVSGNHDWGGNVSAQIAYSNKSPRWKYPSQYHSHSFTASDGAKIDIIMIDTIDLSGKTDKKEDEEGYCDPLPALPKSQASEQWTWIEDQLKASTADYILVAGHYPVYSVCVHGPTQTLIDNLRPLLIQYGAHYVSGHDHCLIHLTEPDNSVNYFVTGMGVGCCTLPKHLNSVPKNTLQWYLAINNKPEGVWGGFSSMNVTKNGMIMTNYDQDGNVLYTALSIPPRS